MRRAKYFVLQLAALLLVAATDAWAAESVLLDQNALLYSTSYDRGVNYTSERGVPLSDTPGTPPGSDGRAPATPSPTLKQFQGFIAYGAIVRPANPNRVAGTTLTGTYAANATVLGLVRNTSLVQPWAKIGAPFFTRPSSLLFGSIIPPPAIDAAGNLLTVDANDYWRPEPST